MAKGERYECQHSVRISRNLEECLLRVALRGFVLVLLL
jgi:hypothetical protein